MLQLGATESGRMSSSDEGVDGGDTLGAESKDAGAAGLPQVDGAEDADLFGSGSEDEAGG